MHELWELCIRRDIYRAAYRAHWNASGIDVLLCPAFVGPAPRLNTSRYWGYTCIWNILDYPGTVFPTPLQANASLDEPYNKPFEPRNDTEKYMHDACMSNLLFGSRRDSFALMQSRTPLCLKACLCAYR